MMSPLLVSVLLGILAADIHAATNRSSIQCTNPERFQSRQQDLGCRCFSDQHCAPQNSECVEVGADGATVCRCKAPATQTGFLSCSLPNGHDANNNGNNNNNNGGNHNSKCTITVDSPDTLFHVFCQRDGTELPNPRFIVDGCQQPVTLTLNLIYSDEGTPKNMAVGSDKQARFLAVHPVRIGDPKGNSYPLIMQNQQTLLNMLMASGRAADEERIYTVTVTDANGRSVESRPVYLEFAQLFGDFKGNPALGQHDSLSKTCKDRDAQVKSVATCLRGFEPPSSAATLTFQDVSDCGGTPFLH